MKHFFLLISLVVLLGILFVTTTNHSGVKELSFTSTQSWDPILLQKSKRDVHYIPNWKEKIILPKPPQNNSREIEEEIALLISYKSLRTEEKITEIKNQDNFETIQFGGRLMSEYFNSALFPETSKLLKQSFEDITTIELAYKEIFNRVRPTYLDSRVDTVIPIPGHPAYPSGHSTQIHFMAYVLSELEPGQKDNLLREAENVAKNREIAGVHYPSDSKAGEILAREFIAELKKNPEFMTQLEKARGEWKK